MAKNKFILNRAGVRELMKSEAMMTLIKKKADEAVRRLGTGYASNAHVGKNRVNSMVYADSFEAKRENSKNNTILKAVK